MTPGHRDLESAALNLLRFDDDLTGRNACFKFSEDRAISCDSGRSCGIYDNIINELLPSPDPAGMLFVRISDRNLQCVT